MVAAQNGKTDGQRPERLRQRLVAHPLDPPVKAVLVAWVSPTKFGEIVVVCDGVEPTLRKRGDPLSEETNHGTRSRLDAAGHQWLEVLLKRLQQLFVCSTALFSRQVSRLQRWCRTVVDSDSTQGFELPVVHDKLRHHAMHASHEIGSGHPGSGLAQQPKFRKRLAEFWLGSAGTPLAQVNAEDLAHGHTLPQPGNLGQGSPADVRSQLFGNLRDQMLLDRIDRGCDRRPLKNSPCGQQVDGDQSGHVLLQIAIAGACCPTNREVGLRHQLP